MTGQAGLKAGLITGAVLFVLALLNLIPALVPSLGILGCVCCGVQLLVYLGGGVLAGFFLTAPREAGTGAGAGAIAGALGGVIAGVGQTVAAAVQVATGATGAAMSPQVMRQLRELDMDPQMVRMLTGWVGVPIAGGICCLGSLVIGAVLGAVGGAIFAAAKPED